MFATETTVWLSITDSILIAMRAQIESRVNNLTLKINGVTVWLALNTSNLFGAPSSQFTAYILI
jgi:hypothetical protein